MALLDEAEALLRALGDEARLGTVLVNRAALASRRHDLATARATYAEAAACYRRAGADDAEVAFAVRGEAATLAQAGRLDEALRPLRGGARRASCAATGPTRRW